MEAYFILPKLISLLWEGALVCTYLFRRAVQCITTEEMRVVEDDVPLPHKIYESVLGASWKRACVVNAITDLLYRLNLGRRWFRPHRAIRHLSE